MIALYLIAAHMVGDFVLQTRWQASRKIDDALVRGRHAAVYCLPFFPVAFYEGRSGGRVFGFLVGLALLHMLTDSRRFRSTLGEWLVWRTMRPSARADELLEYRIRSLQLGDYHSSPMLLQLRLSDEQAARAKIPANPWLAIPLFVDQTLHLCQIALLGGLFLS